MKTTNTNTTSYAGKFLSELPIEILESIIEENASLREKVSDHLLGWMQTDVEEMLSYFSDIKGIDYEIGSYRNDHIDVDEDAYKPFLSALLEAQKCQCFFGDDVTSLAQRLYQKAGFFCDCNHYWEDISEENLDRLSAWMHDGIDFITDRMLEWAQAEYDYAYSDDGIKEHFCDYWISDYGDEYCIDEDGGIYKDVAYREYI